MMQLPKNFFGVLLLGSGILIRSMEPATAAVPPPDTPELQGKFAIALPAFWKVVEFTIAASANYGNDVEPQFRQRIVATVAPVADLFIPAGTEEAVPSQSPAVLMLVPSLKAGENRKLFPLATSGLRAGTWETKFEPENQPLQNLGQPRDAFGGITVVKGTLEETAYRAAHKAEVDRVQQEALDKLAREDTLRHAREKQVADERAEAEQVFRASLAGLNDNIRNVLIAQLPAWWTLSRLQLSDPGRASFGPGNPPIAQNLTATITLNEDTLIAGAEYGSVKLLSHVFSAGAERRLQSAVTSYRKPDGWETRPIKVDFDEDQPRAYFKMRTVLRGTSEEEEYRKEMAAQYDMEKQATLDAIRHQQDIDLARLAAEQTLAKQKADAAAAEQTRQQNLLEDKLAAEKATLIGNVRNLLVAQLPAWWKLDHLDLSEPGRPAVSGQAGSWTPANPLLQNFTGTISLNEDLFSWSADSGPVKLLTKLLHAGVERRIEGTATSARIAESWQTNLAIQPPLDFSAEPRSYFSTKTIVRGTPEEEEYRKEQAVAAETDKQQQLAEIKLHQEVETARLAAEQESAKQKADAAAGEQARQQKLEDEKRAERERPLAALAAALSGSDIAKRQAAIKAALTSGDEDQMVLVLTDIVGKSRGLNGAMTVWDCQNQKEKSAPFSVTISDFDRTSKSFRALLNVASFNAKDVPGNGSLQGLTFGTTGEDGSSFKGRFDGRNRFEGRLSINFHAIKWGGSNRTNYGQCMDGSGARFDPSYPAEVSIF